MVSKEDLRPDMIKNLTNTNTEIKVKSTSTYGYFQFLHSAIMMLLSLSCLISDRAKKFDAPITIMLIVAIAIYNYM